MLFLSSKPQTHFFWRNSSLPHLYCLYIASYNTSTLIGNVVLYTGLEFVQRRGVDVECWAATPLAIRSTSTPSCLIDRLKREQTPTNDTPGLVIFGTRMKVEMWEAPRCVM
jgi:hypothetical protein